MSDHNDLEDARRSLGQNFATALQVGAQLFTAYVQLRLLAMRRAEAQAVEAAEQAAKAAEAVAAHARTAYAHDRQLFANLNDDDWWDQASPEDIQEAAEAAMRWSAAAPEAAAAARAGADGLRERGLEDVVDVDVDALANARVDPATAREFAAMQTGSRTTSTRAAETDPNAQVVADAFGARAEEFLYEPMWDKLSAAIDRAVEDGRFDVVSLLREGDAWRPYHDPDDPDAARRDPAGLLAWRLEDYLDGDPQHPTLTWSDEYNRKPMRPRLYADTVIDGEVINEHPADSATAASTAEQDRQAAYLTEHWPPAAARRLIDSEQWPEMAASLANLRRDGADVAAGLLGPDGRLDEQSITDPDAAFVLVFDPARPDRPPTVAARGDRPQPESQDQPKESAAGPAAPPTNPDHETMAAQLAAGWPEHAERLTGSRRWSEAAERLCRLRDDGVDVVPYLKGLKVKWDEIRDPAAYLSKIIDTNPPKPGPTATASQAGEASYLVDEPDILIDPPQSFLSAADESALVALVTEHWPADATQQAMRAKNWPQVAQEMAFLQQGQDEPCITVGRLGVDGRLDPASLADRDAPFVVMIDPDRSDQDLEIKLNPGGAPAQSAQPSPFAATAQAGEATPDTYESAAAAYMAEHWPADAAQQIMAAENWPQIAITMTRLRKGEDEAVFTIGRPGADGKLDPTSLADQAAPYVVMIDPDRPEQDPQIKVNPVTILGKRTKQPTPSPAATAAAAPSLPPLEERHQRIIDVMREKWPDSADAILTSRRWPKIEATFDDLTKHGTDVVAVIENTPVTLVDKDAPAAYFEKVLTNAHKEHRRRGASRAPEPSRPAEAARPERVWHVNTDGKAISASAPPAFRSLMAAVGPMQDGKRRIALPAAPIRSDPSLETAARGTER